MFNFKVRNMAKVKLNNMKIFQTVKISEFVTMQKVPGGWIHSEGDYDFFQNTFIANSVEVGNEEYELIEED